MTEKDRGDIQAFQARLFEMSSAYQTSQTLYVAVRLKISPI